MDGADQLGPIPSNDALGTKVKILTVAPTRRNYLKYAPVGYVIVISRIIIIGLGRPQEFIHIGIEVVIFFSILSYLIHWVSKEKCASVFAH